MQIYYRISNNSYPKDKLKISKLDLLKNLVGPNCINLLDTEKSFFFTVIPNNLSDPDIIEYCNDMSNFYENFSFLLDRKKNNAQSFRQVFEMAINSDLDDNEIVYFCEDDYWHSDDAINILLEGFEYNVADYITLYDHPDKYVNFDGTRVFIPEYGIAIGGNPLINQDGEETILKLSNSCHWKLTNSTTMTFATRLGTLRADKDIFLSYLGPDISHPRDFDIFLELGGKGRTIGCPIPGRSTHTELAYLDPMVFKKLMGQD